MPHEVYRSLAAGVVRWRWLAIILYAAVTALLGWSGASIKMKADLADLLPATRASGADLSYYLSRFGTADALFFSVSAGAAAGDDSDPEALEEAAEALAVRLRATGLIREARYGFTPEEGIERLRWALDHLPALVDSEDAAALRDRVSPAGIRRSLARLRSLAEGGMLAGPVEEMAKADPLGLRNMLPSPAPAGVLPPDLDFSSGVLMSRDGSALLLVATPLRPPQDLPFAKKLLAAADAAMAATAGEYTGFSFDYAGGYLFAVQDESRIRHDLITTSLIATTAIILLFALALRRIAPLLILMAPLATSTLWTLGIAAIAPGHLNVVTVAFAAILLGMGDDALTHLYLRFRENMSEGMQRAEAVRSALVSTGPSIVVATLCGGVAFASLLAVEFAGLAELGLIAAIGLGNLMISAFVLVPALLSIGPSPTAAGAATAALEVPMGLFVAFHRWAAARPTRRRLVLGAALLITVGAALSLPKLRFASDVASLRGDDPARRRLERVLAPFGGLPDSIHLIASGVTLDQSLARAERLLALCRSLTAERLATACASPSSWLPSLATQERRRASHASIAWDEVDRDLAAAADEAGIRVDWLIPFRERMARYRTGVGAIGTTGTTAGVLGELSALGIVGGGGDGAEWAADVTLVPAQHKTPREILGRARAIDPGAFASTSTGETRAASVSLVVADLAEVIATDFRRASLIALAAVALTAGVAFRGARRLLLVAVPVINGSLLMLGGLAVIGVPINLMNLVATPLVFGLGVNFGVYIVNRHEEEEGADVERVLRRTGGPILLTGLTTLAGFGSLLAADFAGLASMGWVAVLGIGGCLASALLILPLLLSGSRPGITRTPDPSA